MHFKGLLVGTAAIAALVSPCIPASAHDVKDPVCRMTIDSDTTLFRVRLGNKTFYFCSAHCRDAFLKSPKTYVTLANEIAAGKRRDYAVSLKTIPHPKAGRPVPMAFTIRYTDTKTIVPKFELVHQELLHLMMVSDDMRWFEHQHPYRDANGVFRFSWTFPHPGRYLLFFDYTPADGDNQVQKLTIDVGPGQAKDMPPVIPPLATSVDAAGMIVTREILPERLVEGQTALVTYRFADATTKSPVTDMQPFIGVMGHLMLLRDDRTTFMHTHPVAGSAAGSYQAAMLQMAQAGHDLVVSPDMATPTGPAFTFKFTLPKGGHYMTWAQFMHHNAVVTVPFSLTIERAAPQP